jgi:hypothetical protein
MRMDWLRASCVLTTVLAGQAAWAQPEQATVKGDSVKVYREMSARGEVVGVLKAGDVVQVGLSMTGEEGSWCGVARIDPPRNLGYVPCGALERQPPRQDAAPPAAAPPAAPAVKLWSPTGAQKAWALAASALLTEFRKERHDQIGSRTRERAAIARSTMKESWGVANRADLIEALDALDDGGNHRTFMTLGKRLSEASDADLMAILAVPGLDRDTIHSFKIVREYFPQLGDKGLVGWDRARYISLCRWGYEAGFLDEEEAWEKIMPAAAIIQSTFFSWQDLGENYLIGREFWSYTKTLENGKLMWAAYDRLMGNPESPWNTIPWELNLR